MQSTRALEDQYLRKKVSTQRYTISPNSRNSQARLLQYEQLARKAKEQLKQLEIRRKNQPQTAKYRRSTQQNDNQREINIHPRLSTQPNDPHNNLLIANSQKYFKKDIPQEQFASQTQAVKVRSSHKGATLQNKSSDAKGVSPSKKSFLDSQEYKKMHEKLDSIENKITGMKRNLQQKKEEKQRMLESKGKWNDKLSQNQKFSLKGLVTQVPEHQDLSTFNSNPYSPRHNVYYVSQLMRAYLDQRSLAREHLVNSLSILKMLEKSKKFTDEQCKKLRINLPKRKGYEDKKTVIFDLDQTLIHCNDGTNHPYTVKLPIKFQTSQMVEAGINVRPYAKQILKNLSKYFQIIVFTASHSCYANVVIDYLDPEREWIHHRLFRQHCFLSGQGLYVKDLRMINRNLSETVLVDNAAYSYAFQLDNGIPIFPYYHGQIDFELKALEQYLMNFLMVKDVRELNEKTFRLNQYRHYYNKPEKLVEDLYINK